MNMISIPFVYKRNVEMPFNSFVVFIVAVVVAVIVGFGVEGRAPYFRRRSAPIFTHIHLSRINIVLCGNSISR